MITTTTFSTSSALSSSPVDLLAVVCAAANEDLALEVAQLEQSLQERNLEIASYVDQLRSKNEALLQQLHAVQQEQPKRLQVHAERKTGLQTRLALLQSKVAAARQEMTSASTAASKRIADAIEEETRSLKLKAQSVEKDKLYYAQYAQKVAQEADKKMRGDIKAACVFLRDGNSLPGIEHLRKQVLGTISSKGAYMQQYCVQGEQKKAMLEAQEYWKKWLPVIEQAQRDCSFHAQQV